MSDEIPLPERDEYDCKSCGDTFDELVEYVHHDCVSGNMEHLEEGDPCPECEEPFSDEWDARELDTGPSASQSWVFTCPNCGEDTAKMST